MMSDSSMDLTRAKWRLILSPPAGGAWNMAVDEAILESAGRGLVHPTLRLYAWSPPCLSLGFRQPISDIDLEALASQAWEMVRRPTGGRSILHTDELTYSVCGPFTEPRLAGGVLESYRRLSAALLEALHILNIPAETHPELARNRSRQNTSLEGEGKGPVCFEVPSSYEITAKGKKLIGSAQSRKREGVLQHGSLPLTGDLTRITWVLVFRDQDGSLPDQEAAREQAAHRLLERAITAEDCLGEALSWEKAAQAFVSAFNKVLNLELKAGELTRDEVSRAKELVRTKYAHPDWTGRVL
jgi:lipoyl(octanoyl) transferase